MAHNDRRSEHKHRALRCPFPRDRNGLLRGPGFLAEFRRPRPADTGQRRAVGMQKAKIVKYDESEYLDCGQIDQTGPRPSTMICHGPSLRLVEFDIEIIS